MPDVGVLTVRIEGNTADLVASLKKAGVNVKSFRRQTEQAAKTQRGYATSLVQTRTALLGISAVIGGAMVNALRNAVQAQSQFLARLGDLNARLGVSTELLSELEFAGRRTGVQFNNLALSVQRVTRRFGEVAATGGGEALKGLQLLGDEFVEAVKKGQTFEQLLPKIAEELANMEDEQRKLLIAFKLFDSEGTAFLQLLDKGAAGIRELREEAREGGFTVTAEQAGAQQELQAALIDLKDAAVPALREMAVELAKLTPEIKAIATALGPVLSLMTLWARTNISNWDQVRDAAGEYLETLGALSDQSAADDRRQRAMQYEREADAINRGTQAIRDRLVAEQELPRIEGGAFSPFDLESQGPGAQKVAGLDLLADPGLFEQLRMDLESTTDQFSEFQRVVESGALSIGATMKQGLGTLAVQALTQTGDALKTLQSIAAAVVSRVISLILEMMFTTITAEQTKTQVVQANANQRIVADAAEGGAAVGKDAMRTFGLLGLAIAAGVIAAAISLILSSKDKAKSGGGSEFAFGGIALSEIANARIAETPHARPEVIAPLKTLLPMIQDAMATVNSSAPPVYLDGQEISGILMPHMTDAIYFSGGARGGR